MDRSSAGRSTSETDSDTQLALRLIDTVPVPMGYLDSSLVVRVCGKAAADVLGVPRENIVGRHVDEVFGTDNEAARAVRQAIESRSPSNLMMAYTPEGRTEQHWEVACVPDFVDDQFVGMVMVGFDVSNLVDAQRQVADSELLYRSIGELLPYGTWTAREDGSLTYLSDSFVEMTGRDRESLLGWGWLDLLPTDEDREQARADWLHARAEPGIRDARHVIRSKDGTFRHVLCRGTRVALGSDSSSMWAGIHVDVTDSERQLQFRQALNAVKDMLVSSLETEELLAQVGEAVLRPASADFAAVVAPWRGEWWQIRYAAGAFPEMGESTMLRQTEMPLNLIAFRSGAIQVAADAMTDPRMNTERAQADGLRSIAVLPVKRYGASICLLALAYTTSSIVADRPLMDFFADLLGSLDLALQAAAVHEHQRHIAERLQESLLAVPENLPNVELGHLYQAAAEEERVGGDFYDAFKLRGRIAFLVGDISGSGLEAAALTALAKNTIRAHLMDGQSPGTALTKTNVVMHAFTEAHEFATVFIGILDPRSGRLHYACAGHPPPIVIGVEGTRVIEGGGTLLGAFEDSQFDDYVGRLGHDEALVLYTDGITEARRGSDLYGQERLSSFLATVRDVDLMSLLPLVLADARSFAEGALEDDVAMLAIKAAPVEAHAVR